MLHVLRLPMSHGALSLMTICIQRWEKRERDIVIEKHQHLPQSFQRVILLYILMLVDVVSNVE